MHQIRKLFENHSFSNITDHKLIALMQRFKKETNLGIENYQFHVNVGRDFKLQLMVLMIWTQFGLDSP